MKQAEVLKQTFEEAAGIAAVVPEPLRTVAFQRALDELLGDSGAHPSSAKKSPAGRRSSRSAKPRETSLEELVSKINRTEHPEVTEEMPVLQRSLAILKIAKDLGVDGLAAPRIAEILTDKFRIKTRRTHVSEQLSGATKLVDREKDGLGFTYRIMGAGERSLAEFTDGNDDREGAPKPRKRSRRKTPKANTESKAKQKGSRGRPGPKAAVTMLIDQGFFSQARTMSDIQSRLKDKSGYVYKSTDLSPALGRILRDGRLDRDRNENGQYEYQQS